MDLGPVNFYYWHAFWIDSARDLFQIHRNMQSFLGKDFKDFWFSCAAFWSLLDFFLNSHFPVFEIFINWLKLLINSDRKWSLPSWQNGKCLCSACFSITPWLAVFFCVTVHLLVLNLIVSAPYSLLFDYMEQIE